MEYGHEHICGLTKDNHEALLMEGQLAKPNNFHTTAGKLVEVNRKFLEKLLTRTTTLLPI